MRRRWRLGQDWHSQFLGSLCGLVLFAVSAEAFLQVLLRSLGGELEELSRIEVGGDSVNSVALHPSKRLCAFGVGKHCRIASFDDDR